MSDIWSDIKNSAVYCGHVRHRRFVPVTHQLDYPLFMFWLDLDELPALLKKKWYLGAGRFNVASFLRHDYYSDGGDLKADIIKRVKKELRLSNDPGHEIHHVRMLTNLRYAGMVFNPVTFYYCYDHNQQLLAILAEITNTPWGERHSYILPVGQSSAAIEYQNQGNNRHIYDFQKDFHVSPFNPMNMQYRWAFSEPDEKLFVHMDNFMAAQQAPREEAEKHFDATLVMEKLSLQRALPGIFIKYPLMSLKVVWGIYWNALKLWLKKAPFYDHPKLNQSEGRSEP